jgi:hypothetical protein
MRCAPRPTLSSISWDIVIALGFALGLTLFGVSTAMLRKYPREAVPAGLTWPRLIDDSLRKPDRALRMDMIERLSMVRTDWSRDILRQAKEQERDAEVIAAVEAALAR